MKKFTLLIAMLLCFVAFGQKASTPTVEYPTKATTQAEKNQVTNQQKLPYAGFNEVPQQVFDGMKEKVEAEKQAARKAKVTNPFKAFPVFHKQL